MRIKILITATVESPVDLSLEDLQAIVSGYLQSDAAGKAKHKALIESGEVEGFVEFNDVEVRTRHDN